MLKAIKSFIFVLAVFAYANLYSQDNVSISDVSHTPHPTSVLDVFSSGKGILIPRMSSVQRMAIINPANGLMVYDTDSACIVFYRNTTSQWYSVCNYMQGPQGHPGMVGATGPAGSQGPAGPTGASGAVGAVGPQGQSV